FDGGVLDRDRALQSAARRRRGRRALRARSAEGPRSTADSVIALHLAAALAALLLGITVLARTKGTRSHKLLGRTWVAVMLVVALSSFWIQRDGFSWIHLLSIWTL